MNFFKKSIWVITVILLGLPFLVFGIVHWCEEKYDTLPFYGGYDITGNGKPVQHSISPFEFKNQDGKIFSSGKLQNKIVVTNFFFTSCTGICPNMMQHVKKIQDYFLNDSNIAIVSFTVDPETDSAQRLQAYAQQYHIKNANWNLLTGDKRKIYSLARKSFFLSAGDGDGGPNDFIHSEQLILTDRNNHIRGYYDGTDDKAIEQLIHDIKKSENEH